MEKGGGGGGGTAAAAPTGCYKCGRPGHWSRDCPSNPTFSSSKNNHNHDENTNKDLSSSNPSGSTSAACDYSSKKPFRKNSSNAPNNSSGFAADKPKRLPRTRPKLTPDLLLSIDGLGQILRHFPRAFRYRGRGHEVSDLGNLLGLYAEWHSRLLPYFSFDQFVHKVEQLGTKNRVKKCIRELQERVADGVDPAKLHEPQVLDDIQNHEHDARDLEEQNPFHENNHMQNPIEDNACTQNPDTHNLQENILNEIWEKVIEVNARDLEEQNPFHENNHMQNPIEDNACTQNPDTHNLQENILNEIWEKVIEEPSQPSNDKSVQTDASHGEKETSRMAPEKPSSSSRGIVISEEQRARMEANRLKALEKAAARARNL